MSIVDELSIEELKKRLGRKLSEDPRDQSFPMKAVLPLRATVSRSNRYWWAQGLWGNQGNTSQCVAYSWFHWLMDGPVTQNRSLITITPKEMYDRCQAIDEFPGTNYNGTSVRAGAKILQDLGLIESYVWTWNVHEIATAILTTGPVVVGTNWYYDMFTPNENGIIKIGGQPMGGHAYKLDGVNVQTGYFRLKNSWGREWGKNGYAYISFKDMQRLLDEYGEAALAIEIKKKV